MEEKPTQENYHATGLAYAMPWRAGSARRRETTTGALASARHTIRSSIRELRVRDIFGDGKQPQKFLLLSWSTGDYQRNRETLRFTMAKPNYSGEKRRKELEKQRKKEEKKQRKLENASKPADDQETNEDGEATPPAE